MRRLLIALAGDAAQERQICAGSTPCGANTATSFPSQIQLMKKMISMHYCAQACGWDRVCNCLSAGLLLKRNCPAYMT
ncbi:unnamed protein product [Cuscuta campestris]|uniref:Uncharacterized protein n=1 Tax=Cuscuta campestris TaxID=132261 RepID=A0A484LHE4_9ASTE|nr:unnamed protein product [Cuscuta campestris]